MDTTDNIIIGLFPPLFSSIAKDMNVQISSLGIISAVNILVTSFSSILWGYLTGKFNRKLLVIMGTIIWSFSVFLISRCSNYLQLFILQIFTGIGLGCIASIGFSILTDYIPNKYRGMLLSLWGMAQGFGGISGALMASLVASFTSWRKPFEIVSIIGFLLIILYFFIKEPAVGESEPELQKLIKEGIAMFIVPMNGLKLPQNNDPLMILMTLLKGIVTNPWICMIFTLSFFASALQSANTPNWLALIIDI